MKTITNLQTHILKLLILLLQRMDMLVNSPIFLKGKLVGFIQIRCGLDIL